ncbi:MAG: invasion associated locus B family protein [Qingshengfaniella sp.]
MHRILLLSLLPLSSAVFAITPALAQTAPDATALTAEAATPEAAPADTMAPDTASPADPQPAEQPAPEQQAAPVQAAPQLPTSRDEAGIGQTYLAGSYGDWSLRCIRVEQPADICELHQTLDDADGTRTAEINIFPVQQGEAVAGGTVVTPLETLLTQRVRLTVDNGETKSYPFAFCSRIGCVAQIGLTEADLNALRRGRVGQMTIVPLAAPDQDVTLDVSLTGFTAGYQALVEAISVD